MSTPQLKQVLGLWRSILRVHKALLPPELQELGNAHVKSEFRHVRAYGSLLAQRSPTRHHCVRPDLICAPRQSPHSSGQSSWAVGRWVPGRVLLSSPLRCNHTAPLQGYLAMLQPERSRAPSSTPASHGQGALAASDLRQLAASLDEHLSPEQQLRMVSFEPSADAYFSMCASSACTHHAGCAQEGGHSAGPNHD